jgi:CHAD domain-containing protein
VSGDAKPFGARTVAGADATTAIESEYVVAREASADAITRSLQALLPTRHHQIVRHRLTLLDTFDGRVQRAGARLTTARNRDASVLAWQGNGGASRLAVQLKRPVGFAWDLPDGPLQQVLAPVIGVRRLLPQADAESGGSLLEVLDDRRKTVARVRIETGQVRLPTSKGAWARLPGMVTLSGLRGYESLYQQLVPVIASRPGMLPCPDGLYRLMLREAGAPEWRDLSSPDVTVDPTIRADLGARQIHRALLGALVAGEPGLRANLDTEFLHDFRVAIRRTRALLRQVRDVFDQGAVEHFSHEFSWIGRLAGPPRDVDVLMLALREHRDAAPAADMDMLLAFLGQLQGQEYGGLVAALDSVRYRRLLADWQAFLDRPAPLAPEARNSEHRLVDVVARRAWRLSRRIGASAKTINEHSSPEQLHAVRIDAKKLRYLIDVTPRFYDAGDLECILGALKKLQRVLGDFNDANVQEGRLLDCGRAVGAAGGPAGALLALGRLAEQSRQRRESLRGEVIDRLAQFRSRETRSACRRAFKNAPRTEQSR